MLIFEIQGSIWVVILMISVIGVDFGNDFCDFCDLASILLVIIVISVIWG